VNNRLIKDGVQLDDKLYICARRYNKRMKFLVPSSALFRQISMLSGVLNASNTLPILENFLFEIKDSELTISASDLETTMITRMGVESKEDGSIAVPAKILLDTLKSLKDQPLSFDIDLKTFAIEISSDHGKYKLSGLNGEEFPKAPNIDEGASAMLDGEVLSSAINKTLFAAGSDDLRPVMSGLFFEMYPDSLRFVATDAHRLVRYSRNDKGADQSANFIVPKKPLNLLKGIVGSAGEVKLEYNENNACFSFDQITLMCRLIEGKYPNYEAVIPKENPNKLTIDRLDLLQSIKRVAIFANKTTHQVRLKINGSELTISAEDLDFANEANERLSCSYDGEDMEIGFNARFLMDMLGNADSEQVVFEMSAPNRAGIILPVNDDNDGEELLMLVMPVMLNS
jgi:DNA polymerase-3 subunit beta